jgi:hypothetical protein
VPEHYEIRIRGHLDLRWSDWFAGLELTHLAGDETLLSGPLPDQAALHGLLERIRDLNITLISVVCGGPSTHDSRKEGNMETPLAGSDAMVGSAVLRPLMVRKAIVISYSLTGNNEDLSASLAAAIGAEHVRITEAKPRTMGTIFFDMAFNRTPQIRMPVENTEDYDLVLFVGPVWLGQIATPFRACFKELRQKIGKYAFLSVSGGADGPNPKLADELKKRLLKEPVCLIDLHLADLLPPEPKPTRKDTMAYRINERDVKYLTDKMVATLHKTVVSA